MPLCILGNSLDLFHLDSLLLEVFLDPASSNCYLCSISRRFHVGFSFWLCWFLLGTQTHTLLLSVLALRGSCGRKVKR